MPFISIIIPVYNGEKTIGECLNSLMNLDYPKHNYEVIVVDNNSQDKTKQITKQFPFIYLLEKKQGAAAARNSGAKIAKGEILAFIDADVCVNSDWLSQITEAFTKYPQIDGIQGYSSGINGNIWAEFFQRFYEYKYYPLIEKQENCVKNIDTKNFSILKDKFFSVEGFNEEYTRAEDTDLGFRLFIRGYNIKYVPRVRVKHINPIDLWYQLDIKQREFKYVFKSFMSFENELQKVLCPQYFRMYYKIIGSNNNAIKKYFNPFLKLFLGGLIKTLEANLLLLNRLRFKNSLYSIYSLAMSVSIFKGKVDSLMNR